MKTCPNCGVELTGWFVVNVDDLGYRVVQMRDGKATGRETVRYRSSLIAVEVKEALNIFARDLV